MGTRFNSLSLLATLFAFSSLFLTTLFSSKSHAENRVVDSAGFVRVQLRSPTALPIGIDVQLRGAEIASVKAKDVSSCLAECSRLGSCTGFNFVEINGASALPAPAGSLSNSPSRLIRTDVSCRLMTGALTDAGVPGVTSCRMPCLANTASPPKQVAPPVASPGGRVGTVKEPVGGAMAADTKGNPQNDIKSDPKAPVLLAPPIGLLTPVIPVVPPAIPAAPNPSGATGAPSPTTGAPPAPPKTTPPVTSPTPPVTNTTPPNSTAGALPGRVSGWQVVTGPMVEIAPLSYATPFVQCPGNKIALSAGYHSEVSGDPEYGFEVRGNWPDGQFGKVFVRNANVFIPVKAAATAVCVNPIQGLRAMIGTAGDNGCPGGEVVVGGGVEGKLYFKLLANAPTKKSDQSYGWNAYHYAEDTRVLQRLLCAPSGQITGWELAFTPDIDAGPRTKQTVTFRCSQGKKMLAAGPSFVGSGGIVFSELRYTGGTGSANVVNSDLFWRLSGRYGWICAEAL